MIGACRSVTALPPLGCYVVSIESLTSHIVYQTISHTVSWITLKFGLLVKIILLAICIQFKTFSPGIFHNIGDIKPASWQNAKNANKFAIKHSSVSDLAEFCVDKCFILHRFSSNLNSNSGKYICLRLLSFVAVGVTDLKI